LPDNEAAAWEAIQEVKRNRLINHVQLHAVAKALECYNVLIITAGLIPSQKAKVFWANLTNMAEIKDLALRTEQLEEDEKSKTNCFPVNPVDDEDEVDGTSIRQQQRRLTEVATLHNTEVKEVDINHPKVVMNHQEEVTLEQGKKKWN
jgi:hypothetical protein